MAKRRSKHLQAPRPLNAGRYPTRAATSRGTFLVRQVPADRALKSYVCPGCGSVVKPGLAHVVVWPEEPGFGYRSGLDERRHWHSHCWRLQR